MSMNRAEATVFMCAREPHDLRCFGAAHFTLPALVCMTLRAFRSKLGTAYFRYQFVIAAVHAKAISAFVVPEGKGRGINGDPSAGTAAPLKKLAAKHNVRLHFEFPLSEFRRNLT